MDLETRFATVNSSLARETMATPNYHVGRTTREVVGDVASPMEPVHQRVLSLGKSESLIVGGRVRDMPEFGYWLNHCFPITDGSGRVEQLGLFVVNVTAETASAEIFEALATNSKYLRAEAVGLLDKFDEAIEHYHFALGQSFHDLASPFVEVPRKVDDFRSSIKRIDEEIRVMRELICAVISHFPIPEC